MRPRTEFEMAENIRDFVVSVDDHRLIGCGALHFYTPTSGEIRSLAVEPGLKTRGIGRSIVEPAGGAGPGTRSAFFIRIYICRRVLSQVGL